MFPDMGTRHAIGRIHVVSCGRLIDRRSIVYSLDNSDEVALLKSTDNGVSIISLILC
jgi:hypothetical protein